MGELTAGEKVTCRCLEVVLDKSEGLKSRRLYSIKCMSCIIELQKIAVPVSMGKAREKDYFDRENHGNTRSMR